MQGQFTCPWLLEKIVHSNVKVVRASWISPQESCHPRPWRTSVRRDLVSAVSVVCALPSQLNQMQCKLISRDPKHPHPRPARSPQLANIQVNFLLKTWNQIRCNYLKITQGERWLPWELIMGSLNPFGGWWAKALGSALHACCWNQTSPLYVRHEGRGVSPLHSWKLECGEASPGHVHINYQVETILCPALWKPMLDASLTWK